MKQVKHVFNRRLPRKNNNNNNNNVLKAKDIKHITISKRKSLYSPDDNKKQLIQMHRKKSTYQDNKHLHQNIVQGKT